MDIIAKFLTVLSLRNSPNLDFTLQIGLPARKPKLWLSLLTGREGQYGGNTAKIGLASVRPVVVPSRCASLKSGFSLIPYEVLAKIS